MASQVQNGYAFEFAIATAFDEALGCGIVRNSALEGAEKSHDSIGWQLQTKFKKSATNIADFLIRNDNRLETARDISLQASNTGRKGDVRDIVIDCGTEEVGISAKHRHYAIKHPRLSNTIDFGEQWGKHPVSEGYWHSIKPIFDDLSERAGKKQAFKQIRNKDKTVYLPVLVAFEDELKRLCDDHGKQFIANFFQYLIGRNDFYKVICDRNESVIQSININGTLKWGAKLSIPNRIESIERKRNNFTTLIVTFEGGWQISFRIHSASTRVESSLKFDIKFIGMSSKVGITTIRHDYP